MKSFPLFLLYAYPFIVDLTMHATSARSTGTTILKHPDMSSPSNASNLGDAERGIRCISPSCSEGSANCVKLNGNCESGIQLVSSSSSAAKYLRHKTSQIYDAVTKNGKQVEDAFVAPELAKLVDSYANSTIATEIKNECDEIKRGASGTDANNSFGSHVSNELPDVALETSMLRGRKRASHTTQFRILSGRAFKNLYRDPALLTAHYTSAIALAIICGLFYHNVT